MAGGNAYSNAGNWNPAVVPNGLSYDASVDNDFINVDISPTLNSLTIGSNGSVNVLTGSTLTLGSASTPGAVVLSNGGSLNVADGGTLVLASSSDVTITNSSLSLNAAAGNSSLLLSSGGSTANFTLTGTDPQSFSGTLTMGVPDVNGNIPSGNVITGLSGAESLTNDYSHTIQGAGIIGGLAPGTMAGGLTSFTNLGTLSATGANPLNVVAPLSSASWDSTGLNLIGGTYNTSGTAGGNIQLNLGGGNTISGLTANANVTLSGALLTGDGHSDALSGLNAITDSSLTISGTTENIMPSGGTLAVSTSYGGASLASLNVTGGYFGVTGDVTNTALGNGSTIQLTSGATLKVTGGLTQSTDVLNATGPAQTTVDGSNLILGGAFTQLDTASTLSAANSSTVLASGLNNLGVISVDSSSSADFRSGTAGGFLNLSNGGVLTGGTYNISGNLYYDADPTTMGGITALAGQAVIALSGAGQMLYGGPQGSAGTVDLTHLASITDSSLQLFSSTLTNISGPLAITTQSGNPLDFSDNALPSLLVDGSGPTGLTIGGGLTMTSAGQGAPASVVVQNNSTLIVNGVYSQSNNTSTAIVTTNGTGSTLYALGFNNGTSNGISNGGEIDIDAGSTADFRAGTLTAATGTFSNLSGGTLTGGIYNISGTLNYDANADGGLITKLQNATVTLNGTGRMLFGGTQGSASGTQAFSGLSNITDSSFTLNNATALTSVGGASSGLALVSSGAAASLNLTGTSLAVDGNLTASSGQFVSAVNVGSGSTLNVAGNVNFAGSITVSGGSSLTAIGPLTLNSYTHASTTTASLLNVNGSTLSAAGFTNNGSSIVIDSAGTADLRTGTAGGFTNLSSGGILTGGSYNVSGTLLVDGSAGNGGISRIAAGTSVTLSGNGAILSGGSNGSGTGTATNALNGILAENDGTLVLQNTGSVAANLTTAGVFTNTGSVTINGTSQLKAGTEYLQTGSTSSTNVLGTLSSSFINIAGGTTALGQFAFKESSQFTNTGTFMLGNGLTATFTNTSQSLGNLSGGTLSSGTWDIAGTMKYAAGGLITGIGTGATVDLIGSGKIVYGNSSTPAFSTLATLGGTLEVTGGDSLSTSSQFTNTGTLVVGAGSSIAFNKAASSLANLNTGGSLSGGGAWDIAGTMTYAAGGNIKDIALNTTVDLSGAGSIQTGSANALSNLASVEGTLDLTGGDSLTTTTAFSNSGVVNVSGGPGVDALTVAGQFNNSGTVTVGAGDTLTAGGSGYTQSGGATDLYGLLTAGTVDLVGGSLFGTGTVSGNLIDEAAAVVNPGDPGTLTVGGNYTQAGELILDVDGATPSLYDNLSIGGNVSLSGTLDVNLAGSFLSSIYTGETFQFLTFGSGTLSGNFSTVEYSVNGNLIGNAAALNAIYDLSFSQQTDAHDITFGVTVTPEPGTWFLLSLGLLLVGGFEFRRRRNAALRIQ
jgi:hypothetical protein